MSATAQDAHPFPIYNARFRLVVPLLDADGDPISPSSPDTELSQDMGTFADATNEATEIATSSGIVYVDLIATEMDTTSTVVKVASTGAKTTIAVLNPRRLPIIRTGTAQAGAATTITLDSSASAIDDYYVGCYVNITNDTPTNARGQARVITDYVGSTKVATVATWGTNPSSSSTFEILATPDWIQRLSDVNAISGVAVSTSTAQLGVNVVNVGGSAVSQSGGLLNANVTQISSDATAADNAEAFFDGTGYAGTGNTIPTVTTVTNQVTANVTAISGDSAAADNLESYTDGTTPMPVNVTQVSGDSTAADNAEAFFDGTGYAGTNNVIPLVTTVTNLTNAATSGDLTATMKASVNTEVDTALTDYGALKPTTAGRTLDVTATGAAGIDWSNVENPTTAVNLSATNIDPDQVVASVTGAVGSVTGAVGSVTAQVSADVTAISGDTTAADKLEQWLDGFVTGTAQSGDVTYIQLAAGESSVDDIYYGYTLRIVSGTGAGQTASITQYTGVTKNAEVFPVFGTAPDNTSVYLLVPHGVVQADVNGIRHDNQRATDLGQILSEYNTDGYIPASVLAVNGDTAAAGNLEADYDGTGYDKSNSTIGTATNVTSLHDVISLYFAALTRKTAGLSTDISSIFDAINLDFGSGAGTYDNTTDSIEAIRDRGDTAWITGTTPPTAAAIADAVWDETLADHLTAGSTGNALNAAGSAGDPWSTAIPGAYGAGTAGKIIGDNLNATVSSRASQTSVDTIDDFLDTEIAAILADTNELQTDWADGGRLDLILDARASQSSLDTLDNFVDTEVAAILEDTGTTLPAQIAALSIPTAGAVADAVWDEATAGHTTIGTYGRFTPADVVSWDGDSTYIPALNLIMEMYQAESYVNANLKAIGDVDLVTGTAQTGSSSSIRLAAGESSVASVYVGYLVLITSGTGAKQLRYINGYNGTTKDASVTPAYATNPDNTSVYLLIPTGLAGADILAILSDENAAQNLQNVVAEYGNEGYLPANVTGWNSSPVATPDTAGYPVVTVKDGTGQGEISTTSGRVGVNLDDTAGTLAKGTDLTGFNDLDAAGIRTSVGLASANLDTQLTAIDDFLDTEIAAIKAKTDNLPTDPADQSAVEAAITAATSGLATAANLATLTAYVDTEVAAILEDTGTTIPAQIAALNNLSAAQVNTEVDTALTDIHLDHLLATDYDPANKPGVATALLNELIGSDAGVSQFTVNALELAPSGGGGGSTAADIWAYATRTLTTPLASVESTVTNTTVTMYRGDVFNQAFTGLGALGTWTKVYLTIKKSDVRDEQANVQIMLTNPSGIGDGLTRLNARSATLAWASITVDDANAGDITVFLDESATRALEPGEYDFDIQYVNSAGSSTRAAGTWTVNGDVTRAIS